MAAAPAASDGRFQRLNKANCNAAFQLQCQCHSHPWSERVFTSSLQKPYFAWQWRTQQQVLGYYLGLVVVDEATLMDIGVADFARGKGLGQQLLQHFFNECQTANVAQVWLEVRVSNSAAINLYERNGFAVIERRKNYYPLADGREDALIMQKRF